MSVSDPKTSPKSTVHGIPQDLTRRLAGMLRAIAPHIRPAEQDGSISGEAKSAEQGGLSESAARYQRLARRMSAMVFELAPDGTVLFVDQGLVEITGYSPEELQERNWRYVLFPGEQAKQLPELFRRLRSGDVAGYDLALTHKSGTSVSLGLNTANHYDRDGTLRSIVGWAIDRTQHRCAQASARNVVDALGERIKELTVLYGVTRILQDDDKPVCDVLREVVTILPRGWRYLDVAGARISWDDQSYATPNFASTPWMQRAKLATTDGRRGVIEVCYLDYHSEVGEPPFLNEETALLDAVAELLRSFLQRREALQDLHHAHDELEIRVQEHTAKLAGANAALRTERDMLQTIMENTHTQLAYLDMNFNYLRVNSAYARDSGYTRDQLLGRNHFDLFPDANNQAIFERVRDTGQAIEFRARPFQYADQPGQEATYWDWTLNPVLGEAKQVQGLVFSLTDVTERESVLSRLRNSEAEARARADELAALMDAMPVYTFIAQDAECHQIIGNREAYRLMGLPAGANIAASERGERVLSKSMSREGFALPVSELPAQKVIMTGEPLRDYEVTMVGEDGVPHDMLGNVVPLFDDTGHVRGTIGAFLDITEIKRTHTEATRREQEYREAVERLRLATTAAGLGVFEWDVASDHVLWENERMYEIFGRRREQGPFSNAEFMAQVLHPDDREGFERDLTEGAKPDHYFISTCRIHRGNDKAWRWIEYVGRFTLAPDGRPRRLVGTVADVTDRRQALDSLRESEARLSFALDVSQMGHWELDLADHTAHRSLRHDQIFGYQELLPRWTYEIFLDHVLPQDRAKVAAAFGTAVEQGTNWDFECRITRVDGALRWIWACGSLRHDEYSKPRRLVGIVQDITARKQAEEERENLIAQLGQLASRDEAILNHMTEGVMIADGQGNVLNINPAARRIHGHTSDEKVDKEMVAFVPSFELRTPEGLAVSMDEWPLSRVLRGETFDSYGLVVRRTDTAQTKYVSYGGAPVRDEGGQIILTIVTSRDVTAQREAEQGHERLLIESRQREAEVSALLAISHDVASRLELEPLLDLILDRLQTMIECTGCAIFLLSDDILTAMDYHGPLPREEAMKIRFSWREAIGINQVIQGREAVIIDDVQGDSPLARAWQNEALPEQRALLGDARSWLGVPLVIKNQVIGLFYFDHLEPGRFGAHHARLAMAIADQAALAVENARLYARAQHVATIEERQRIARELHDSVSQVLYSIVLGSRTARMMLDRDPAKAAEPIDYVFSLAEAGLAEMRALIFELRPDALESEGLVRALQRRVEVLRARHGLKVDASLGEEPHCGIEVKEAVYRVAQEAMHNMTRHARATDAVVRLTAAPTTLELQIRDNGIGFDPEEGFPGRLGLRSMRERVLRLGGTLSIESAPGQGTLVRLEIPI